ncbi:unnamed protein product [Nippostrongylus brasiliensis]|uniref:Uncharacterized protein n=1 Tax=Nippostrongylus brasiliensis TaxID=27835 RepID=A0A0N4XDS8_NIPBR|nr:unnamed protein product [Nippostrongylus brasiliensis]
MVAASHYCGRYSCRSMVRVQIDAGDVQIRIRREWSAMREYFVLGLDVSIPKSLLEQHEGHLSPQSSFPTQLCPVFGVVRSDF